MDHMCGRFRIKYLFNVRFFCFNVRLCVSNVRFFRILKCSADVQCPVMKRILFPEQQILKEQLQELCCFMNTVFQIIIVCPDK